MKFKEWFENNLKVGSFPFLVNKSFDPLQYEYVINVSDEFYSEFQFLLNGLKTFWFPMNECKRDIGLNSLYGAMVILYQAEKENKKVYLHCHAGVNRSRTIQQAYYYLRTGEHLKQDRNKRFDSIFIVTDKKDETVNEFYNMLLSNCNRGYLPPKAELEKFLSNLKSKLTENKMQGGILDSCKIGIINNF
jgi:protein-tyrosine phosphatase